jgi:hypothetical protein
MNFNQEIARRLIEGDGSRLAELQDAARQSGLKPVKADVHPDSTELKLGLGVEKEPYGQAFFETLRSLPEKAPDRVVPGDDDL